MSHLISIYSEEPESENCNESWIKHVDGRVVKSDAKEMLGMEKYELECLETVRLRLDENLVHKVVKEEYFAVARELGFASKRWDKFKLTTIGMQMIMFYIPRLLMQVFRFYGLPMQKLITILCTRHQE